jgi:hypothetical protein
MANQDNTSGSYPIRSSSGDAHTAPRGHLTSSGLTQLMQDPKYSYSNDVSPEFQERIEKLTKEMGAKLDSQLGLSALGGDVNRPFSAIRDGDVVHLMIPQHINSGDLLAACLMALASQIPTCILHESSAGWAEPEWSAESRKHLGGIVSAIKEIPKSFAHSTSPTDLVRISLWITACSSALSRPGGVPDAHGDVLPTSVGGQRSASKYLSKVIAGLRSNVLDETMLSAIDALTMLLKIWQKVNHDNALTIARNCKLAWSTVLFRAAPTEVIKGKRNKPDQTVVRPPSKPSRSPWLSQSERSALGTLLKDDWSFLENFRKDWIALPAVEQHKQFNSYIRRIKAKYEELNVLSISIHSKLGKRKYWIERLCKQQGYKPKVKKGESDSFLLSTHFFQQDLSLLNFQVAKVFAPITYLPNERFAVNESWSSFFMPDDEVSWDEITFDDINQETKELWSIWVHIWHPLFPIAKQVPPDPPPVDSFNMFKVLDPVDQES